MTLAFVGSEHARAFAPKLIEVASLNARVSDAIIEQINRVRKARALAPSSSLLVLGPAGAGKTHLFERMRRKVGAGATFVHVRPEIGVEESLEHVLLTVVDALKQPVANQSYAQLDVAVGSSLALVNGESPRFPSAFLEKARAMSAGERDDLVQRALDHFEREDARLDTSWLELFLSVPFVDGAKKRAALAWLSGREPSELELRRLGLSERLTSGRAVTALRALATIASHAAPLVVVFDQLENLVEADGRADRIHAHARVFSELHDEVSRMVLVQMALDGEWTLRIGPQLAPSERSRLEARVLHVELPTPAEREELVHRWLEQVAPEQRGGAFPWPFTSADWQRLRSQPGATPRMLLVALRNAAEGEPPFATAAINGIAPALRGGAMAESSPGAEETDDALARHWEDALREAHAELQQAAAENRGIDEDRLAAAMRVLLLATGCVKVDLAARRKGRETLRLVREGIQEASVFVVQSTNGRSVAAALGHARKTSESKGVIVVREQALALPPTWKTANEHLDALQRTSTARVVAVGRPELARALALHDLLTDARSQDLAGPDGQPLSEAAVRSWVQRCLDPSGFSLALGKTVLDEAAEASAPAAVAVNRPAAASERPGRASETPTSAARAARSLARAVLVELRLASVERVVAEAQRRDPNARRARVLAELRADPAVRWFGRTVVHLPQEAP